MALLVFAILNVMCCYFCYFVGTQKGYNGPLCAFAGLFGSFLACLILLLMPDKASDTFNSAAYNREAVSYTHLDVYKRQSPARRTALRCRGR